MANNKKFRFGPLALTTTLTTNLLNPPAASGGVNAGSSGCYILLNHVRVHNNTAAAATVSTWLGASGANAAGTACMFPTGASVAANDYIDYYGALRLDVADFLVGGSNTGSALTIMGEGEIGIA